MTLGTTADRSRTASTSAEGCRLRALRSYQRFGATATAQVRYACLSASAREAGHSGLGYCAQRTEATVLTRPDLIRPAELAVRRNQHQPHSRV